MTMLLDRLPSPPVLLLVHGAWFGAWSWEKVQPELLARGWEAQTIDLPSLAERGGPRFGLYDDAERVRQRITEIDGPVVVVAHSYGGAAVTQGAAGLPNVRHLVYVCGYLLDVGESVLGLAAGGIPDSWNIEDGAVTVYNPRPIFLQDVAQEDAVRAIDRLKPTSLINSTQELSAAAWHTISSTYIACERDNALPPQYQDLFAARATYVRHLPSGHLPLLSMPAALTDLIVEAAAGASPANG
jgi:pimeloyl-ACP methyl ester carboxylesterase